MMCINNLSDVLSVVSVVMSVIAFYRTNPLQRGQVEMQIRELISNARYRYLDVSARLSDSSSNMEIAQGSEALLEDLLNAYDEACAKYIDNKVDRKRFKKIYFDEIKQLYEHQALEDKFQKQTTRFQAIRKVYDKWNKLEK